MCRAYINKNEIHLDDNIGAHLSQIMIACNILKCICVISSVSFFISIKCACCLSSISFYNITEDDDQMRSGLGLSQ